MRRVAAEPPPLLPFSASAAATAGLVGLRELIRRQRLRGADGAVRNWVREHRSPTVDSILRLGDIAGKPPVSLALASAVGAIIARGSGVIAGLPVPLAAVLAFVAQKVGKRAFHRDRPPRALREGKTEPSYPSGHVTTTVAVGLTAAYVLSAEELVPASVSLPIALSLVGLAGGAKIYDERHWTSDVLGGVLAGVAVAALAIGARMLKERGSKGRPSSG